eukprot:931135-Prymnesium_polylepis.1
MRSDGGGYWRDVRIPLQYAVVDSTLTMPPTSKRTLRGFAPPPPLAPPTPPTPTVELAAAPPAASSAADGTRPADPPPPPAAPPPPQACSLWVRYRLANEIRTARIADDEAAQLGP